MTDNVMDSKFFVLPVLPEFMTEIGLITGLTICLILGNFIGQKIIATKSAQPEEDTPITKLLDGELTEKAIVHFVSSVKDNEKAGRTVEVALDRLQGKGLNDVALLLFNAADDADITLTPKTCSIALTCSATVHGGEEFAVVLKKLAPSVKQMSRESFGQAVRILADRSEFASASTLVERMRAKGIQLDQVSVRQLLPAMIMGGEAKDAMSIMMEWRKWIEPTGETYDDVIRGLLSMNLIDMATELMEEPMQRYPRAASKMFTSSIIDLEVYRKNWPMVTAIANGNAQTVPARQYGAVVAAALKEKDAECAVKFLVVYDDASPEQYESVLHFFDDNKKAVWPFVQFLRSKNLHLHDLLAEKILNAYCTMGSLDEAFVLFQERMGSEKPVALAEANAMLLAFRDHQGGAACRRLLDIMCEPAGPAPDADSFRFAAQACGKTVEVSDVLAVLLTAKERGLASADIYNAVIECTSETGDFDGAFMLIEEMQQKQFPLSAKLIGSLVDSYPWQTELVDETSVGVQLAMLAIKSGFTVAQSVLLQLLRLFMANKRWYACTNVLAKLNGEQKTYGLNLLLKCMLDAGASNEAAAVLEDSKSTLNGYSYFLAAQVYHQQKKWQRVLHYNKKAEVSWVKRSAGFYMLAFEACSECDGKGKLALDTLDSFLADGYVLTERGYFLVMKACSKQKMKEAVRRLYHFFRKENMQPSDRILAIFRAAL